MKEYVNPWTYQGVVVEEETISKFAGFVYLITNLLNGRQYIGRKYSWINRKKKGATRRSRSESNWKEYYGSNEFLQEDVKNLGAMNFKREILHFGKSKGEVNFLEIEEQFKRDVLYSDHFYNDQIQGKYFKKNVIRYRKG